jgi:signal transduction histidine kinase
MTTHDSIAPAASTGSGWNSQPPDGMPASVLVVDDNAAKRQAICAVITGMGLQATELASGHDALRLLLKQDFALILLDVRMPGMDGFETAALIHGRPSSAHTPVIFVTAEAQSDVDRALGYTAGAVDYIGSPIVPEVLCAKVKVFVDLFYMQRRLLMQTEELRHSKLLLQQLASHQEIIKEEERKRIAREIHDELGQNLLALRIDASMLHARTGARHPRLNEKAQLALEQIDITIRSVRSIINDLRPPVLDLGLQAAIEWQVDDFQRRSGIACALRSQPHEFDQGLDERSATALFRILQESLTNVLRHARARRVDVELWRDAGHFHMRIADDGVGLRPEHMRDTRTFGLQGMRERLRMLDGELTIGSARGGGTELRIAIPVQFRTGVADNPRG